MRLPFLALTPACVSLGTAAAYWETGAVNWFYAMLVLFGAAGAHMSVNLFNEYHDFRSGLDFQTRKTPFSGGSGTLPRHPEAASAVLLAGWLTLAFSVGIGIFFMRVRGWRLLPLGMAGAALILTYTPWATRRRWWCLVAPGLGFGPLMVMGTHFVLAGRYSPAAFAASLIPFFLVNNLLLLNQFPDAEADRAAGRDNLPVSWGRKKSAAVYGVFLICAYGAIIVAVFTRTLPAGVLLGLGTAALAWPAGRGARRFADETRELAPYLGLNVIINLLTPVLMAAGLFLWR